MIGQEEELRKNHLITTLDTLEKQFNVSFEVKPISFDEKYTNVIHFTTGNNSAKYGSRTPGVWFVSDKFYIASAVNDEPDYSYGSVPFPPGGWIAVQISQIKSLSDYTYSITINGNVVHTIINNKPAEFRNVKIFAADPWHGVQPGSIRNFVVYSKLINENSGLLSFQHVNAIIANKHFNTSEIIENTLNYKIIYVSTVK